MQLNENRRCFWYIVMLCKFNSIIGTCILPFAYICFNVTTVAHVIRSIDSFNFCGRPRAELNFKKGNILYF